MQHLCTPQNVNTRDIRGRFSTPLHFAAGFNRVSTVEYLLQNGADVHARDKGWANTAYRFIACSEYTYYTIEYSLAGTPMQTHYIVVWFRSTMPAPMATMKWLSCWSSTMPTWMQLTYGNSPHCTKLPPRASMRSASYSSRYYFPLCTVGSLCLRVSATFI